MSILFWIGFFVTFILGWLSGYSWCKETKEFYYEGEIKVNDRIIPGRDIYEQHKKN